MNQVRVPAFYGKMCCVVVSLLFCFLCGIAYSDDQLTPEEW
jgi:hypothetical protein